MRKTTMTVAAFMVAAASYAATIPTNDGVKVDVKAGEKAASVELSLKKGTYQIKSEGAKMESVTSLDGNTVYPISEDGISVDLAVSDDKGLEVKVNLTVTASEKEPAVTVMVTPTTEEWVAYVKKLQNQESASFSLSKNLPAGEDEDKDYEKTWHDNLVNKGVELQGKINKLGIEDYNAFVEAGGKLEDLEKKLDAYETEAKTYSDNYKQYKKAIEAWNGINYTALEDAWKKCEQKKTFQSTYDGAKAQENSYKNLVEIAYKNVTAATSYADEKIYKAIEEAQKAIDEAANAISTNNTNSAAYGTVQLEINNRISAYNTAVDGVYREMIAHEKDTYDDYYKMALEALRAVLGKVNDVKAEADALNEEKKLDPAKADELITKLPAESKFETSVSDLIEEVTRLREAYVASTNRITDLTNRYNKSWSDACGDSRTDKNEKSISGYFTPKRNAIINMLKAIQKQLDESNKKHEHENQSNWDKGDNTFANVNKLVADLDVDYNEYKYFVQIRYWQNQLKNVVWNNSAEKNPGIKQQVEAMKYGSFVATNHFSSEGIDGTEGLLTKYIADGNVYVLDSKSAKDAKDKTPCKDFYENIESKEYSEALNAMRTYLSTAQNAYDQYKTIADALTGYKNQIDGTKDKDGKVDIQSWTSVVKNENVTIDGHIGSESYADAKSKQDKVSRDVQKAVTEALTKKEKEFTDAITAAAGKKSEVANATEEIISLKSKYDEVERTWYDEINIQAAKDAKDEANALVKAISTEISNAIPTYKAEDYGTAAANALTKEANDLTGELKTESDKIEGVPEEPTKAIVYLNTVKKNLIGIQGKVTTHEKKAEAWKKTFGEVKSKYTTIYNNINGLSHKDEKGNWVVDITSLTNLLGSVNTATSANATAVKTKYTQEKDTQQTALNNLWNKINGTEDIAKGLTDVKDKDGKVTTEGFKTTFTKIGDAVDALRENAQNEDKNQQKKNTWDGNIGKYRTLDKVDQSVEDILAAAEKAIYAADGNKAACTEGEHYFLNLIQSADPQEPGYRKQVENLKSDAEEAYTAKTKEGNYTDTEKNMVAKYADFKSQLDKIINAVDQLGSQAETNEIEHKAQEKALGDEKSGVIALYNEINVYINSSKPTAGENTVYDKIYAEAIKELSRLNSLIKEYKNGYTEAYENGKSQEYDAGATKIKQIADDLQKVKDSWDAGDNSYAQAVIKDNAAQKAAYDDKWHELYDFYYGSADNGGAIAIINRLKGLTQYSDNVNLEDEIKQIATAASESNPNSMYARAEMIQKLKDETDAAYKANEPTKVWSNSEYVDKVNALYDDVETLRDTYAEAINKLAREDYDGEKAKIDGLISQASTDIQTTLRVSKQDEVNRLLKLAKNETGKTVLDIQNDANQSEEKTDFAFIYVNTLESLFKDVEGLCKETKDLAAKEYYSTLYNKIDTSKEAAEIAEFYYVKNASEDTPSSSFQKGGFSKEYAKYIGKDGAWYMLAKPETVKFSNYTQNYGALWDQVKEITLEDNKTKRIVTAKYKEAYYANLQYLKNLKNETELTAAQNEVDESIATAKNYATNLLVEHDSEIASAFANIGRLTSVDDKKAKLARVDAITKDVIFQKEYVNVGLAINDLVRTLGNKTEVTDELSARNETIWSDLSVGRKDEEGKLIMKDGKPDYATFEETYNAFLQIEKDIAKAYNGNAIADAQTAVNAKVAEAVAEIATTRGKQKAAHAKNNKKYGPEVDVLDRMLGTLNDKIGIQGDAIVIEQENNIKAANNIIAKAKEVANAIGAAEKNYLLNDQFVKENTEKYDNLVKKFNTSKDEINALKYAGELPTYISSDGKTIYKYTEEMDREFKAEHSKIAEWLKGLEQELDVTEAAWESRKSAITTGLKEFSECIIQKYNFALFIDGRNRTQAIQNEISLVKDYVETTQTQLAAERKENLNAIASLQAKKDNAAKYQNLVVGISTSLESDAPKDENVGVHWDINGIYSENVNTVVRKDAKNAVDAVYDNILVELKKISESIVTPGAITDGNKVQGDDVQLMVDYILGKETPKEGSREYKAADVNGNGAFDVADLQYIIDMLMTGGANVKKVAARITEETIGTLGLFNNASSLNLTLDTELNYSAVQLDITLPAGVIMTDAALASQTQGVVVKYNKIGKNTWRVLAFSNTGESVIESLDFMNISLAGHSTGMVVVDNVRGAVNGRLIAIPGAEQDMNLETGINATMAQTKAYFYGIDGTVRNGVSKGITIVKDAANKVKKVLSK